MYTIKYVYNTECRGEATAETIYSTSVTNVFDSLRKLCLNGLLLSDFTSV